ncbi:AEC family transporter [Agathobaculum sp.]|uniref:AEC family transporter n=1 Tax=Agathobaculum sp. TaxID=2048138 RepID=UPI002A835790|nr:AEC family transporter [Agathobaculum sp.]MDY3618801.1 AEC family transporter [Agathobaculum sp.]
MFTNSFLVLQQIIVMFLLIAVGFLLFRQKIFDNHITQNMSLLLNKFIIPMCILRSFQRPFDAELGYSLVMIFVCGTVLFLLSIVIINRIYRPEKMANFADRRVAAVLTNNGFMALPLLEAMFGTDGVFLGSAHIACMAIVLWTYGINQLSGGKEGFGAKNIFCNPAMLATIGGFILFCSPVKLPEVVFRAVDFMGDINTPLAMFVLGCFLAQTDLKKCFADRTVWQLSAVRLLFVPAVSIVLLLFVPLNTMSKLTLLTGVAAPCAIASAMFGQIYHTDYLFSTRAITLTTILSAFTLPFSIAVLESLLRLIG